MKYLKTYEDVNGYKKYMIWKVKDLYSLIKITSANNYNKYKSTVISLEFDILYSYNGEEIIKTNISRKITFPEKIFNNQMIFKSNNLKQTLEILKEIMKESKYNL